jgi:hypothetical protein
MDWLSAKPAAALLGGAAAQSLLRFARAFCFLGRVFSSFFWRFPESPF